MADLNKALISVSDKTDIVKIAKGLVALGAEVLSTGGTAKTLRDEGVTVTEVSSYTGSPEILGGRVKTLHPKIHGGLLGRRRLDIHVQQMQEQGIDPIDVVVVNLYPFETTISKPGCSFEEAIEQIDIGGPSMLRSAAKNHEDVLVVVDPADYGRVLEALHAGTVSLDLRRDLARKVFQHTARYDSLIATYLEQQAFRFPGRKISNFTLLSIPKSGKLAIRGKPSPTRSRVPGMWRQRVLRLSSQTTPWQGHVPITTIWMPIQPWSWPRNLKIRPS